MGEEALDLKQLAGQFLEVVKGSSSVLIGSHLNPDGDAIGSVLAMAQVLDQLGISTEVAMHHAPPANLKFLPGTERINIGWSGKSHPTCLVLDLEALDRLGSPREGFDAAPTMVVIDHHVPIQKPGHLRIVSTAYPATCGILTDLIQHLPVTVTPDIAECLVTGILTDTGNFRYPNTTAASLHQVAWLVELGADVSKVSEEVYMRRTLASSRLEGFTRSAMKLTAGNRLAYVTIPYAEFERYGADEDDTEGFVSEILGIQGVEAAFLLRESKPGKIRGSIRSRGQIDVASAAREFGGGGHRNAAGVSFEGDPWVAESQLIHAVVRALESSAAEASSSATPS
jgi:bifunctional oligoribonuclease and PAP phosphatase NrnA